MITADNRPTDQEYAWLNQHVHHAKDLKARCRLWQDPSWIVYCIESRQQGYCGVIYVNNNTRQVVLVHQETTLKGTMEGVNGIIAYKLNIQQQAAFAFLKVAIQLAQKLNFHLSFTGYFWGGFLAEVSVFHCHVTLKYGPVNAVVFESPGSKETIERSEILQSIGLANLDISNYVTPLNLSHNRYRYVGTVHPIANYNEKPGQEIEGICSINRIVSWFKKESLPKHFLSIRHFLPSLQFFLKDFYAHRFKLEQHDDLEEIDVLKEKWYASFPAKIVESLLDFNLVKDDMGSLFVTFKSDVVMFRCELSTWLAETKMSVADLLALPSPAKVRAKAADNRPTDQEYAWLNQHACRTKDLKVGDYLWQKSDWVVYWVENDQQGYCGVIYVNGNLKQVVLVHQQTALQNTLDFELHGKAFNDFKAQQRSAFGFSKVAARIAQSFNFHLSFTGYFWGGVLAELSVFDCHVMLNYRSANAVTFESPGSKLILEKLKPSLNLDSLDILGYATYYDQSHHVGTIHCISTGSSQSDGSSKEATGVYPIDKVVGWFEKASLPKHLLPIRHFSPLLQFFLKDFYEHRFNLEQCDGSSLILGALKKKWQMLYPSKIVKGLLNFKLKKDDAGSFLVIFEPDAKVFRCELSAWLVESKAYPANLLSLPASVSAEISALLQAGFKENNSDIKSDMGKRKKPTLTGGVFSSWSMPEYESKKLCQKSFDKPSKERCFINKKIFFR